MFLERGGRPSFSLPWLRRSRPPWKVPPSAAPFLLRLRRREEGRSPLNDLLPASALPLLVTTTLPPPSREEFEALSLRVKEAEQALGENIKLALFLWKAVGATVEFVDSPSASGKPLRDA